MWELGELGTQILLVDAASCSPRSSSGPAPITRSFHLRYRENLRKGLDALAQAPRPPLERAGESIHAPAATIIAALLSPVSASFGSTATSVRARHRHPTTVLD